MWLPETIATKRPISCNFCAGGMIRPIHGLVLHIQEGTEDGTWAWFNKRRKKGSSAHFGNPKHGKLEQFVDTDNVAWAQGAGNYHWISVENEGKAGDSLTTSQIQNLAALMNWLHDNEGVPLQLADNPAAFGLGYHSMGGKPWGHPQCPGTRIVSQRLGIVLTAEYSSPAFWDRLPTSTSPILKPVTTWAPARF
jgi:hypothetical protein